MNTSLSNAANRKVRFLGSTIYDVMDFLSIDVKRITKRSFWIANEHELDGIYKEFSSRIKEGFRKLHPDTGGDGYAFGKFREASKKVEAAFKKKGFGGDGFLEHYIKKQEAFEAKAKARINGPIFREYSDEDEIDLSLWKIGTYDRIVEFATPDKDKEPVYGVPISRHPPCFTFSE